MVYSNHSPAPSQPTLYPPPDIGAAFDIYILKSAILVTIVARARIMISLHPSPQDRNPLLE